MGRSKRAAMLVLLGAALSGFAPAAGAVSHDTAGCGLWENIEGSDWMICGGRTIAADPLEAGAWAFVARGQCIRGGDDTWFCDLDLHWRADDLLPTQVSFTGHDRMTIDATLSAGCEVAVVLNATSPEYRSDTGDPSSGEVGGDLWRPALGEGTACGRAMPRARSTSGYIGEFVRTG